MSKNDVPPIVVAYKFSVTERPSTLNKDVLSTLSKQLSVQVSAEPQ